MVDEIRCDMNLANIIIGYLLQLLSYFCNVVSCQPRRTVKNPVISIAVISIGYLTRLRMDLIDLRTRPDKDFQWILRCRDRYSKYSWTFALNSKEAQFIADKLITLFYRLGPGKIPQ